MLNISAYCKKIWLNMLTVSVCFLLCFFILSGHSDETEKNLITAERKAQKLALKAKAENPFSTPSINQSHHSSPISTDGIVQIETLVTINGEKFKLNGTAFFIKPQELITDFFMITGPIDYLKEQHDTHPKISIYTKDNQKIEIERILHADALIGLAHLKTKDYKSETFYSLPKYSTYTYSYVNEQLTLLGYFEDSVFNSSLAIVSEYQRHSHAIIKTEKTIKTGGLSSPLFNVNGKLIAVLSRKIHDREHYINPIKNIQSLLSNPALLCNFNICIQKSLDAVKQAVKEKQALALYVAAMNLQLSIHKNSTESKAPESHTLLLKYLRAAAEQNFYPAKKALFTTYANIEQNYNNHDKAHYLRKLDIDLADFFYEYARMHNNSDEGTHFDYQQYRQFLLKAAEEGHSTAKLELNKEQSKCTLLFEYKRKQSK